MSAWIVSKEHIDALVQGLAEGEIVVTVKPDELGRILWNECLTSVAYRYPNDGDGERPGPIDFRDGDVAAYTYARPASRLSRDALLKQAHCYDYQSCEHPTYETSQAHDWIYQLVQFLEESGAKRESSDYDSAAWGL